jgi:hypothetical protein
MLKHALILAAGAMLLISSAHAAQYDCIDTKTSVALNDYDIKIKNRESAVAEMRDEIKGGGGSTEQQKKALESFEQKLAAAKAEREALLIGCKAN